MMQTSNVVSKSDFTRRKNDIPSVLKNHGGVAAGFRNYVFHVSVPFARTEGKKKKKKRLATPSRSTMREPPYLAPIPHPTPSRACPANISFCFHSLDDSIRASFSASFCIFTLSIFPFQKVLLCENVQRSSEKASEPTHLI